MATPDGGIHLIDYGRLGFADDDPFGAVLRSSEILKIFHAADQDLELLALVAGEVPSSIWDTQLVSGIFGYTGRLGYAATVESLLGTRPLTDESLTDWSRRPLTPTQLHYAAEDVRHLIPLQEHEAERLDATGRTEWAAEECEVLRQRVVRMLEQRSNERQAYQRVKGWQKLDGKRLRVLQSLALWREAEAERRDRPRTSVLKDDVLVEIARRLPGSVRALGEIRTFPGRERDRLGGDLISVVTGGLDDPPEIERSASSAARRLDDAEKALVSLLQAVTKAVAHRKEVAPSLVATAADIEDLVRCAGSAGGRGESDAAARCRLLTGWRREVAGEDLLRVVSGETGVRWDPVEAALVVE